MKSCAISLDWSELTRIHSLMFVLAVRMILSLEVPDSSFLCALKPIILSSFGSWIGWVICYGKDLIFSCCRHIRYLTDNSRWSSSRTHPDAKLHFEPLPVADQKMPTLNLPLLAPQVIGSAQLMPNAIQSAQPTLRSRRTQEYVSSSEEDEYLDMITYSVLVNFIVFYLK